MGTELLVHLLLLVQVTLAEIVGFGRLRLNFRMLISHVGSDDFSRICGLWTFAAKLSHGNLSCWLGDFSRIYAFGAFAAKDTHYNLSCWRRWL